MEVSERKRWREKMTHEVIEEGIMQRETSHSQHLLSHEAEQAAEIVEFIEVTAIIY